MSDLTAARARLEAAYEAAKDKVEELDEEIQALTRRRDDAAERLAHIRAAAGMPDQALAAVLAGEA